MSTNIDQIRQRVIHQVETKTEIEDGYQFTFNYDESVLLDLREFTTHEAECCSFLDFEIKTISDKILCTVTVNQYDLETAKEIIFTLFSH